MRALGILLAILMAMSAVYGLVQRTGDDSAPAPESPLASADTASTSLTDTSAEPEPAPLSLAEFAAQCASTVRERNPRGRVLRINANLLAERCSVIVETDEGSARWLFDWRDADDGFVHEGELRLPEAWSTEPLGATITPEDADPARIAKHIEAAHAAYAEQSTRDWLYEILYLPAPFSRPIVYVTLSDTGPEAEPYDAYTAIYDGEQALQDADYDQAMALYPMTRFELREDHNFKGPLYESTALAEAATSLESDPDAGPPAPLARAAEDCMHWVHQLNRGTRLLRVAWNRKRCHYVLESAQQRNDFYLLTSTGREDYREHPSVVLDAAALPNLLLDRSRLTSARVRERLAQAIAAGAQPERMAVFWVPAGMVWRFEDQDGQALHLDESGHVIAAPDAVPVTALERAAGFGGDRLLPLVN